MEERSNRSAGGRESLGIIYCVLRGQSLVRLGSRFPGFIASQKLGYRQIMMGKCRVPTFQGKRKTVRS